MKNKWNEFTATERAAIIGGVFTLFTAILILCINYFKTNAIDLKITGISIIPIKKSYGIEILFWNKSNMPIALTSINLALKNSDSMREPIEQSIYYLNTDVDILSKLTGYFKGKSIPKISEISKNSISYPISGNFHFSEKMDSWSIYLKIPVREELMSGKNQSVVIIFPESISIIKDQESKSDSLGSNVNKQELLFSKLINDCKEPIQVLISVVYADDKKSKSKTSFKP